MGIKLDSRPMSYNGLKPSGPIQRGDMTYDKHLTLRNARLGTKLAPLPRRFSREKQALRSQDIVGACVAFSTVNSIEADTVTFGDKTQLSPAYVYALCQKEDGYVGEGTSFETARKVLKEYGVCDESLYPFNVKDRQSMEDMKNLKFPEIKPSVITNGKTRRIKDMYRVPLTIENIKRAIYEENSVLLGMTITDTYLKHTNGCIGPMGGFLLGAHAVDCCSWDDDKELTYDMSKVFGPGSGVKKYKGGFRFENHWVDKYDENHSPLIWWGDDGYGWLPYELLNHKVDLGFTLVTEAWVIVADDTGKNVDEDYHHKVSEDQFDDAEVLPIRNNIYVSLEVGSDVAYVNGDRIIMDCNSVLVDGRTMVPLRFISEVFGATVGYTSSTKTATIDIKSNIRGISVKLPIGSKEATINGKKVNMDTEAVVIAGRTLVPIRFISEVFGAVVGYTSSTKTATITITPDNFANALTKWDS